MNTASIDKFGRSYGYNYLPISDILTQTQADIRYINQSTEPINASTNIITSVPNPVNPQDPVNLQYLNANSVSIASGNTNYLRLDGTNNPTAN